MRSLILITLVMLLVLSSGCTNRYMNASYVNTTPVNRYLSVYPIADKNIHIKDSTILDFIIKDYDVAKENSVATFDSLLNRNIHGTIVLNTENVIVSPYINKKTSSSGEMDTAKISEQDRRILKRLGIILPDENSIVSLGYPADLVLFIANLEIDIKNEIRLSQSGTPATWITPLNNYTFSTKNIAFVIWDYKKNSIVCSGKIDASAVASRCDTSMIESVKNAGIKNWQNKVSFWPFLLSSIGNEISKATPFSKNLVDSIMNECEWRIMKKRQLTHPQRDSAVIASRLETIYPTVLKSIDGIAASFDNRESIRLGLTISPIGRIYYAWIIDSVKVDSAASVKLNTDISGPVCDSISNTKLYTIVKLGIDLNNTKARIHFDSIKYVELRPEANIDQKLKQTLPSIRGAYNKRLREGMDKKGIITVRFTINDNGNIISSSILSSTMNDPKLELEMISIIKKCKFYKIYNPGDIRNTVYPFIFSH